MQKPTVSLDLCLRKTRAEKSPTSFPGSSLYPGNEVEKSYDYRDVIVSKRFVFKMFFVHAKTQNLFLAAV